MNGRQAYAISDQSSGVKILFFQVLLNFFQSWIKDMTSIGEGAGTHPPPSVPQWVIDPDWTGLFMHLCILLLYYMPCFTVAGGEQQSKIITGTSFV